MEKEDFPFKDEKGDEEELDPNIIRDDEEQHVPKAEDLVREGIAFENKIKSAKSFDELFAILDEAEVIEGSSRVYTSVELRGHIERVRSYERRNPGEMVLSLKTPLLGDITRAHGIRQKVIDLLEAERKG